jgi:hypothetical protein
VDVRIEGKTVSIGLTPSGITAAHSLASSNAFADIVERAKLLRAHFDLTASNLMRFIYETFPEVLSLQKNQSIDL